MTPLCGTTIFRPCGKKGRWKTSRRLSALRFGAVAEAFSVNPMEKLKMKKYLIAAALAALIPANAKADNTFTFFLSGLGAYYGSCNGAYTADFWGATAWAQGYWSGLNAARFLGQAGWIGKKLTTTTTTTGGGTGDAVYAECQRNPYESLSDAVLEAYLHAVQTNQ
jgi:hypothetical protein